MRSDQQSVVSGQYFREMIGRGLASAEMKHRGTETRRDDRGHVAWPSHDSERTLHPYPEVDPLQTRSTSLLTSTPCLCASVVQFCLNLAMTFTVLLGLAVVQVRAEDKLLDQPIRHLFVPLEEFDAVMAKDRQGVLLKKADFEALIEQALKHQAASAQPSGLVISSANYVAKIDGDQLVLAATIQFTNFDTRWAELSVPTDGLSVEKCQINGQPALAGWHGEKPNVLRVYTDVQGAGTLSLELSARLSAVGSDLATGFGVVPAASGELVVSLPAGKFLTSDGSSLQRTTPADQPAEYHVSIGGRSSVSLQITNRQTSTRSDSLTLANTAFAVAVAPGEVAWSAKTALQVVGRPVDRIVCTVPQSLEITGVESTGLESWQLSDTPNDPARTTITLAYRQPLDGSREISFRGVLKAAADAAWEVPTLVFNEMTSQVGVAEVRYPAGVRLRVGELDGVRSVVSQAVTTASGESLLHFQIWKPRFKLPFVTEPKNREVRAAMTQLLDINSTGLDFTAVINLQTRLAPLFDAQVNIPAAWQIRSVFVGDQSVTWQVIPQEASLNQVRITFPQPIPADEMVSLTLNAALEPDKWPVAEEPTQIALPRIQLPQVGVIEGLFGISAEPALDIVPTEVVGLDAPSPAELEQLRQKIVSLGRNVRLGFSLQDSEYKGQLNVSRKPARLSSQQSTYFRIEPDALNTHIETQLQVEGGGVRQLLIDLPESTGTDLRFSLTSNVMQPQEQRAVQMAPGDEARMIPPKIVEQTAAAPRNGLRRWTLRLDRYANDAYLLSVDIRQPRSASGPFSCPALSVVGAERQTGFVAIEASQEQFLSPVATDVSGQPLQKVDPIDFPSAKYTPKETIVAGFRYTRPGWTLAVGEQRFDRAKVPTAIGHSADYKTVYGRNGELQHQADLEFTAVGVQNLKVRLPAEVVLWAVQLDGAPQEIRQQGDGLLVAVPQDGQADKKHSLTLFYRSSVPATFDADFRQAPPSFTVLDGRGEEQPLNLLKQSWNLYHPNHLLLVESPGAFQPTRQLDRDGALGQWSSMLRAPSPKQIRDSVLLISVVFLLIWGLRKSVEKFGWLKSIFGFALVGTPLLIFLSIEPRYANHETAERLRGLNESAEKVNTSLPQIRDRSLAHPTAMPAFAPAEAPMSEGSTPVRVGVDSFGIERPTAASALGVETNSETQPENAADAPVFVHPESMVSKNAPGFQQTVPFGALDPVNRNLSLGRKSKTDDAKQVQSKLQDDFAPNPPSDNGAMGGAGGGDESDQDKDQKSSPPESAPQPQLGGLLSLALTLVAPDDSVQREFTFLGDGSAATDLHLTFVRRDKSRDWTCFVMTAVFVLGWFCRRLPWTWRSAMVALLVLGSIALAPLLPGRCQPLVDGLFFGGWLLLIQIVICGLLKLCPARCCSADSGCKSPPVTAAALLFALSLLSSVASAEDKPAPEVAPKPAATLTTPVPPPTTAPTTPHVVLPYSGDDPSTADRVYIPQDLYLKLWKQAHPEETRTPAPVDGLVVEALYAASFEQAGDNAVIHVKARLVVMSQRDEQITLLLPIREVALKKAVIDGQSASLQADGGGYSVVLSKKGPQVLDVEFDLPAITEGPAGRFTLKVLPTAAAKLSVQLPKIMGDRDLRVNGATGAYRIRESEAGPVLDTAVDRGGDVTVSWQPRATRGAGTTIVHVETGEAIAVDDSGLQVNHHFAYRVRQGALTEVSFLTIPSLTIREISGPDVGGWQLDDAQGTTRRLRVFLRRTVEDQTQIVIDQFTPLAITDATLTQQIPELVPMDATREIGQIALFAGDEFSMRAVNVTGAVQIDVNQYKPTARPHQPDTAPLAAYRFATRPASLSLSLSRKQPETKCVAEHGVQIGTRKVEWASRYQFDLTGAPCPSVSMLLPTGYLLMEVEGADFITDWYDTPGENGQRTLTVEFDQPRLGRVDVLLQGVVARKVETPSVDLSPPNPLGVNKLKSSLGVWLSEIYSATVGTSEGWKTASPDQLSQELQQLRSTPAQFAFQAATPVSQPVVINLTRQVPQLSADLVMLVAVADDSIDYGLTFRWKITRAAADTFQFTTPNWLKGRLELNVAGVREIRTDALESGDLLWTIQLVDAVRGQFLCTGVVTLPPPADDVIQIPDIIFLDTIVAGKQTPMETQRRCAIVVNRSAGQLAAVDERLVNKLPADQLPLKVDESLLKQALAITEINGQQALPKWKLIRSAVQESGRAIVTGSDLETSLAWDGSWKTRAVYTVRNRGQQFLGLKLPAKSQLMSVFVKGQPSRTVMTTVKEQTVHLVPLPQTSMVDLSFDVQVTVSGQLPTPLERDTYLMSQEISLPAPDVVTQDESADFGLTVAYTNWRVFTPDKLDVTLVSDYKQSNLDQLNDDQRYATIAVQMPSRLEADAKDLFRILSDSRSSYSQKAQSQNNLKQLEQALAADREAIRGRSTRSSGSGKLYEEAESRSEALFGNLKKHEGSLAPGEDGKLDNNRDFIISSNNLNIISNSGDGLSIQEESKLNFRFEGTSSGRKFTPNESPKSGKSASGGRGSLRKSLESQSLGNSIQTEQLDLGRQATTRGDTLMFGAGVNRQNGESQTPVLESESVQAIRRNSTAQFWDQSSASLPAAWTQTGGLSLPFEIPTVGHESFFTKIGGSPKLTLSLRPRQAWTRPLTWLWSLCWGLLALWTMNRICKAASSTALRPIFGFAAALSVLGFMLLPTVWGALSFLLFVVCLAGFFLIGARPASEG
jgi:hypothetical protein